ARQPDLAESGDQKHDRPIGLLPDERAAATAEAVIIVRVATAICDLLCGLRLGLYLSCLDDAGGVTAGALGSGSVTFSDSPILQAATRLIPRVHWIDRRHMLVQSKPSKDQGLAPPRRHTAPCAAPLAYVGRQVRASRS